MNRASVEQLIADKIWSRRKDLRHAFLKMDKSRDGLIDFTEFKASMKKLNIDVTDAQIDDVFKHYDVHGNGYLCYYEFLSLVREPRALSSDVSDDVLPEAMRTMAKIRTLVARKLHARHSTLAEAFLDLDDSRDGYITVQELENGLSGIGVKLDEDELALLVSAYDTDKNGRFSYQEFVAILTEADDSFIDGFGEREDYKQMSTVELPVPPVYKIKYDFTKLDGTADEKSGKALKQLSSIVKEREMLLKRLFDKWDKDGSHSISKSELDQGLREMGIALSRPALLALSKRFDEDGNIRYSDFVRTLSEGLSAPLEKKGETRPGCAMELDDGDHATLNLIAEALYDRGRRMKRHFQKLDLKGSGRLTPVELQHGLKTSLKIDLPLNIVENLVSAFDTDHDGKVRYGEFIQMIAASDVE